MDNSLSTSFLLRLAVVFTLLFSFFPLTSANITSSYPGTFSFTNNANKVYPALANNSSILTVTAIPKSILTVGISKQIIPISTTFYFPLTVQVKDANNRGVGNATVTFQAPDSGPSGVFSPTNSNIFTAMTDANGLVKISNFIANELEGSYMVTATVSGVSTPAIFKLTNSALPTMPRNVTITPGDTQIVLKWSAPTFTGKPTLTGYNIYSFGSTDLVKIASVSATTTSYTVTGLANGFDSTYFITAFSSKGESKLSSPVTANPQPSTPILIPAPPALLSATGGDQQITLVYASIFIVGSPTVTGYNIYRATNGNKFTKVNSVPIIPTEFTDMGLTNGTVYTYTVSAINSAGESAPSSPETVIPHIVTSVPYPPTLLKVITVGDGMITLSWKAPTNTGNTPIVGYALYRGIAYSGRIPTKIGTTTDTQYSDTGLTNGIRYEYFVRALNSAGESAPSNENGETPHVVASATPGSKSATGTGGNQQVILAGSKQALQIVELSAAAIALELECLVYFNLSEL
jgi:fibronectin type 3 domain-containing protein